MAEAPALDKVRLDVWLDVACLFRTRSEAQRACNGGKVEVGGVRAKPHRDIRPGDTIEITRPGGRHQRIVVRTLVEKHIPKAEARTLYEDITPPPTAEELQWREILALSRRPAGPGTAPHRRDRRMLRKVQGKE